MTRSLPLLVLAATVLLGWGAPLPTDPPEPPVYEAAVESFFGADGSPRLERAYPGSC